MELWVEKPFFVTLHGGRSRIGEYAPPPPAPGRVPRVARLMALALKLERQRREGTFSSQADIARLGNVTDSYVTQIMNLLNLAADIQEELLFLPLVKKGRAPVKLKMMQRIASEPCWNKQREMWRALKKAL